MKRRDLTTDTTARAVFLRRAGLAPTAPAPARQRPGVCLKAFTRVETQGLRRALAGWQIDVTDEPGADLTLVLVDSYLDPRLDAWNREALAAGRAWMLVKPSGLVAFIGPTFRPGKACWKCEEERLRAQDPFASFLEAKGVVDAAAQIPPAYTPETLETIYLRTAWEVARLVEAGVNDRIETGLLRFDLSTWEVSHHPMRRRSDCPVCAAGPWRGVDRDLDRRLEDVERQGRATLRRTHRRVRAAVCPVFGPIRSLHAVDVPGSRGLFAIRSAQYPIARHVPHVDALLLNLSNHSSAIARRVWEAETLAICEALEHLSGVPRGREAYVIASARELGPEARRPEVLHHYSDDQYARRQLLNAQCRGAATFVPERLSDDQRIAWARAWSLTHRAWCYVPMSSSYYGWHDEGRVHSLADSRGTAAGPTRAFALVAALLEHIQTDAVAIWHGNFLRKPAVDVDSFDDPYLGALRAVHAGLDRDVWVLDVTADLPGVHVFVAVSRHRATGNVVKGVGTHPDAARALRRAIMECTQMLSNVVAPPAADARAPGPSAPVETRSQPQLVPAPGAPVRRRCDYPDGSSVPSARALVQLLAGKGIETLVQDMTYPDFGLRVVRTFAVGLRSWFNRLAPGRLYEVPVAMEERTAEIAEADVNRADFEDWATPLHGEPVDAFLASGRLRV